MRDATQYDTRRYDTTGVLVEYESDSDLFPSVSINPRMENCRDRNAHIRVRVFRRMNSCLDNLVVLL